MSNMYRYLIDGVQYTPPAIRLSDDLKRDFEQRWVISYNEGTLNFGSDLYHKMLLDLKEFGYCVTYDLLVQRRTSLSESWINDIEGTIQLSASRFFHEKEQVEVEVFDNSFEAKIKNNRTIDVDVRSGKSKNDVVITPVDDILINLFNPIDSTYGHLRESYDVKEVFTHLVSFMSDGTVGFESTWYDSLPNEEKYALIRGHEMRTGLHIKRPEINFKDLFETFANLYNLYILIDKSGTDPVLRIETQDYAFDSEEVLVIENVRDIEQYVNERVLYANVLFGTSRYNDIGERLDVRFLTIKNETYSLTGNCNTETTLDLSVEQFIIDNNLIEDTLIAEDDQYDDDVFIVQYRTQALTYFATKTDPLAIGQALYNGQLFNDKVSARYNLGSSLAAYLGDGNDQSLAEQQAYTAPNPSTQEPFDFNTEIYDPNNNFGVSKYTAPANGVYSVAIRLQFENLGTGRPSELNKYFIRKYDASNALIEEYPYTGGGDTFFAKVNVYDNSGNLLFTDLSTMTSNESYVSTAFSNHGKKYGTIEILYENIFMEVGNYVQFRFESNNTPIGSYRFGPVDQFEVYNTINGGGIFNVGQPLIYRSSVIEFNHEISQEDWDLINAEPWKAFVVTSRDNARYKVWVDSLSKVRGAPMLKASAVTNIDSITYAD